MIRSVDDLVGKRTNARHRLSLGADRREQSMTLIRRMRATRFAETMLQCFVRGFEEKNDDVQTQTPQRVELFFEAGEKLTFTNVDDECSAPDSLLVFVVGD